MFARYPHELTGPLPERDPGQILTARVLPQRNGSIAMVVMGNGFTQWSSPTRQTMAE